MNFKEIDNLIFDLGGVILNIDHKLTAASFARHGAENFGALFSAAGQNSFFDSFETGRVDAAVFRETVCRDLKLGITPDQFNQSWNAMLKDIPSERIDLLVKLKSHFRTFLLSNTNSIHIDAFHAYMQRTYNKPDFTHIFEKAYYSYEIGLRKPDIEIYRHVIRENGLDPKRTMFLDDFPANIEGAREAGLNAVLVNSENDILKLFHEYR